MVNAFLIAAVLFTTDGGPDVCPDACPCLCPDEQFTFQNHALDQQPDEFTFAKSGKGRDGKWRVVQDGEDRVLAQLNETPEGSCFPLAVVKDFHCQNVKLHARIKAVGGKREQTGGLIWRYQDSKNYLLARVDIQARRVRLYRIYNGNRVRFGTEENVDLHLATWYTLRVEHVRDKIKVYLNDEVLMIEKDKHFPRAGGVGLWTMDDAVTYFDDFQITDLDRGK